MERDVLKWYPMLYFSSHLRSSSKNMINRYGLRVSPCMLLRLIVIGGVVLKWFPVMVVVDFLYMSPTISTPFARKPRSSIMASNHAWSMNLKIFLKSIYVRYISLLVSFTSLRATVIVCICLEVLHCGLNPFWLKWIILCCSP